MAMGRDTSGPRGSAGLGGLVERRWAVQQGSPTGEPRREADEAAQGLSTPARGHEHQHRDRQDAEGPARAVPRATSEDFQRRPGCAARGALA